MTETEAEGAVTQREIESLTDRTAPSCCSHSLCMKQTLHLHGNGALWEFDVGCRVVNGDFEHVAVFKGSNLWGWVGKTALGILCWNTTWI